MVKAVVVKVVVVKVAMVVIDGGGDGEGTNGGGGEDGVKVGGKKQKEGRGTAAWQFWPWLGLLTPAGHLAWRRSHRYPL